MCHDDNDDDDDDDDDDDTDDDDDAMTTTKAVAATFTASLTLEYMTIKDAAFDPNGSTLCLQFWHWNFFSLKISNALIFAS